MTSSSGSVLDPIFALFFTAKPFERHIRNGDRAIDICLSLCEIQGHQRRDRAAP